SSQRDVIWRRQQTIVHTCFIVLLPQPSCLNFDNASQATKTHILRPSPYFKGQFMTTHSSNVKTVIMSEDGQTFTTLL
ncbi:unnamed protein product, partial [Candidula unifasciata]